MTALTLPRSIRNNNPGNMRPGIPYEGISGTDTAQPDPPYLIFCDVVHGFRAIARCLMAYESKHGIHTIAGVFQRWAPGADNNDPAAYGSAVAAQVGVGVNDTVSLRDRAALIAFCRAIAVQEGGQIVLDYFSDQQIGTGVDMALGTIES